jgi:hypothetical protein
VVTEWADGIVQIMHAEEYHRPDYNEMLSLVYRLISKYQIDKVYIDGANPSFIKSLKLQIGEVAEYDKVIARYRSEGLGDSWSNDGVLDKEATSYNDIFDAFRLALKFYHFEERTD